MPVRRFARVVLGLALFTTLSACEDDADKGLASAQSCLNTATASTIDTCLIPIAGQTTAAAYAIRCAADFIAQGFTSSRLTSAFQDVNNNSAATKPMLTAVTYLSFYPSLPAGHTVDNAVRQLHVVAS